MTNNDDGDICIADDDSDKIMTPMTTTTDGDAGGGS